MLRENLAVLPSASRLPATLYAPQGPAIRPWALLPLGSLLVSHNDTPLHSPAASSITVPQVVCPACNQLCSWIVRHKSISYHIYLQSSRRDLYSMTDCACVAVGGQEGYEGRHRNVEVHESDGIGPDVFVLAVKLMPHGIREALRSLHGVRHVGSLPLDPTTLYGVAGVDLERKGRRLN